MNGQDGAATEAPGLGDDRAGATAAQIALAWLLDLSPNVQLILGTRTRQHLPENIRSHTIPVDEAARAELARQFLADQTG